MEHYEAVGKLTYAMGVSLDGFVADASGAIDWTAPDDELHRFHNERVRDTSMQLMGRRLYETMLAWNEHPQEGDSAMAEFARIWVPMPKVVFSRTLDRVEGAELVREDAAGTIARLKEQESGEIAIGGAGLAATCIEQGLVDEYHLFVYPVILGAGTPYFPPLDHRIGLELLETRTFASKVVFVRYGAA